MSRLYKENHRAMQDEFGTRKLADRIEKLVCQSELDEAAKAFIEAVDMFFLATTDGDGRPTVSHKGGAPGFVKVVDSKTLVFPSYNGNGMFLSMGNIEQVSQVGLLFISFENPERIRVQGTAEIQRNDPLMAQYPEADFLVRVSVSEVFPNCSRYIHTYERVEASPYVPQAGKETPVVEWKRLDTVQDALPPGDLEKAQKAGIIVTDENG